MRELRTLAGAGAVLVFNGALVELTAGVGMYIYATMQKNPSALILFVRAAGSFCLGSRGQGEIAHRSDSA